MRTVRDVVTLSVGAALCLSQLIVQQQGAEPSLTLVTAGVSLLAGWPLLALGDRRADPADDAAGK